MNLLLTRTCNERCAFCYAYRVHEQPGGGDLDTLLGALRHYARLVREAPAPAIWDARQDEPTRLLQAARAINLLGGEPTLHPHLLSIVGEIAELGLGSILFTNGSHPEVVHQAAPWLWSVCVNGYFAQRVSRLDLDLHRVSANLALRPDLDALEALEVIHQVGVRAVVLAFATPAGQVAGPFFTPEDQEAMTRLHRQVLDFCRPRGILVGYDCSFPHCVQPGEGNHCSAVPIMDTEGQVTICGGRYFLAEAARPISAFHSLQALHAFTLGLQRALRQRPSRFAVCNRCPEFNTRCNGMCLAYRQPA